MTPKRRKPRTWVGWVWMFPSGQVAMSLRGLPATYRYKKDAEHYWDVEFPGRAVKVEIREVGG